MGKGACLELQRPTDEGHRLLVSNALAAYPERPHVRPPKALSPGPESPHPLPLPRGHPPVRGRGGLASSGRSRTRGWRRQRRGPRGAKQQGGRGVLVEPCTSEGLPQWRFRTREVARASADELYRRCGAYKDAGGQLLRRQTSAAVATLVAMVGARGRRRGAKDPALNRRSPVGAENGSRLILGVVDYRGFGER